MLNIYGETSMIDEILVESYPGMFEDFDKYVMQNHVLNARQKLEILFRMFADKVENNAACATESSPQAVDYDVLRNTLTSSTKMWKDMSLEEKNCIVHFLNSGDTVCFTETLPCWVECVVADSYRSVSSTRWGSGLYYWIA